MSFCLEFEEETYNASSLNKPNAVLTVWLVVSHGVTVL